MTCKFCGKEMIRKSYFTGVDNYHHGRELYFKVCVNDECPAKGLTVDLYTGDI